MNKMKRKPRKPKTDTIATKLRDLLGFDNVEQARKALNISLGTMSNLNAGKAGITITSMALALIAFIEAVPSQDRKVILLNMKEKS